MPLIPAKCKGCIVGPLCKASPTTVSTGSGPASAQPPLILVVGANDTPCQLRSAVVQSLGGPAHHLVIDLTAVRSMGNEGLAVLVGARARQRARRQGMSLIYLRGSVTDHALSRAGLRSAFPPQQS